MLSLASCLSKHEVPVVKNRVLRCLKQCTLTKGMWLGLLLEHQKVFVLLHHSILQSFITCYFYLTQYAS